ncbi:YdcF family protein [Paraglaciecola sp. MB-3u-78]|jgi:uncharacterized SAM-binding protein YcdF (DUF218 family)|uniref:YdcF family protein n=1 Tax=Paraglaciecola sp. MB-3u-78 TaxID=2058332 RepID=UPI000C31E97F|nr:YdcF family protein [Paraglaciecola sp. MB-3u-78]PKG92982.1 YdcF family protein [Paraglaciecola sp. MB-3u-78]
MTLAYVASILSSPLIHAPILFIIIRIIGHFRHNTKLYKYLSIGPVAWLLFCSMTYPSVLLIKKLEDNYPVVSLQSDQWKKTDAIVVLACNHFEDDELPFVSRWPNCSLQRNLHAALMYKIHPMPIYLAGGILGKKDNFSQASHNKAFFELMGVDGADIFITPKGSNTESEAKALSPLLQGKWISLVTSASHLPRAVKYFEDLGIKVLPIPVEHFSRRKIEPMIDLPNASSLYRSERAIHEYLGLIYQGYFR